MPSFTDRELDNLEKLLVKMRVHQEERGEAECAYTLTIYLLYDTQADPDAAEEASRRASEAIEKAFKAKVLP